MKIFILAAALTGIWVSPTGDPIEVACPRIDAFEDGRARLPRGCSAHREGVWLSADRYKALEVRLREAEAQVEAQEAVMFRLTQIKDSLQKQLIQCSVQPLCAECPSTTPSTLIGVAGGALLSFGGCALWTATR